MTVSLVQTLLDFVDRAQSHGSHEALECDFRHTIREVGFDHFMIARLPSVERLARKHIVANTWPTEWLKRYHEKEYHRTDPVTIWAQQSSRPFTWTEARSMLPAVSVTIQIENEAASVGLVDGVAFQLGDIYCTRSVFSAATDRPVDLPISVWPLVHLAAQQFQQKALEVLDAPEQAPVELTPREREILKWAATGKSYWETSSILGISAKTVEAYLARIRQKLDVSNTTHAVVVALASGQIKL